MRILVTGWRDWPLGAAGFIESALSAAWPAGLDPGQLVVVHGRCPYGGVDLYADRWARTCQVPIEEHPADWARHGKAAGMLRNSEMVKPGADLCLGFPGPGSRGTWDCLRKAVDAGIRTEIYGWHGGLVSSD